MTKRYNDTGMRLTNCCGAVSTYMDEDLCCKKCYREVTFGQGDGSEYRETTTDERIEQDDLAPALPLPDGWGLWHTGGGCTAWGRNLVGYEDACAMITGDGSKGNCDDSLAPTSAEGVTLGLYMDEDGQGTYHTVTLSAALAWVQDLERTTS